VFIYVGFAQPDEWPDWAHTYAKHMQRFEAAAGGERCICIPFDLATPDLIHRINPSALVLSGFARSFQDYKIESFFPARDVIDHAGSLPILALCGSHQLLGFMYNGSLNASNKLFDEPMRKRRPGEPVTNPDYHPEFFMERGFFELELHGEDPIFAGCGKPPIVYESHYCEIKKLPPGFRLLASTPDCRIQAMRHMSRPIISVEFHPEDFNTNFPDGRKILENFFKEAKAAYQPTK
jgi:GMP synthase-like glutamine amidotransferase